MSTGYGWEGLRQVCATLLGAHHVPERLCGGLGYLGRYNKCSTFTFLPFTTLQQVENTPVINDTQTQNTVSIQLYNLYHITVKSFSDTKALCLTGQFSISLTMLNSVWWPSARRLSSLIWLHTQHRF